MPDDSRLKNVIASVDYIREKLTGGVSKKPDIVSKLKAELLFILRVLNVWEDDHCAGRSNQVDWFKYNDDDPEFEIVYDLSGMNAAQIDLFRSTKQIEYQQYLDVEYPGYQIVRFNVKPKLDAGGNPSKTLYIPEGYLCPPVVDLRAQGGGPNAPVDPQPPPK